MFSIPAGRRCMRRSLDRSIDRGSKRDWIQYTCYFISEVVICLQQPILSTLVLFAGGIYGFMWGVNHLMSMEHEIIR